VPLQTKYKMAKKLFLNRERAIPTDQILSVRREEGDTEIVSSSTRKGPMTETAVQQTF